MIDKNESGEVLINAANLHVGGGVQVAVSFIYEMARLAMYDFSKVSIIASTSVDKGISALRVDTDCFKSYQVVDLIGIHAFTSVINKKIKGFDVVFTIFGPNYLRARAKKEIVGFAQLWMVEQNNSILGEMSFISRLKTWFHLNMQWQFFKRSDLFVVELDHVKRKLIGVRKVLPDSVTVVHNTVSSVYFDQSLWDEVAIGKRDADLHLGLVSRDYRHKNISILPSVAKFIQVRYGLNVCFYVTFDHSEWEVRDDEFKKYVTNVGMLLPNQCPSFYQQMDGVVFPSLLECFSATPFEAMIMEKPLFGSDRDFVRDTCGDHAIYFDPLDACSIAEVIVEYFFNCPNKNERLLAAKFHAQNFSSARGRAISFLEIITKY